MRDCLRPAALTRFAFDSLFFAFTANAGTPLPDAVLAFPAGANVAGGNSVLITGGNMANATSVTIGGQAATIFRNDSSSIYVTSPAHAAGTVDVVVVTPGGTDTLVDAFTYSENYDAGRDFSAAQNPVGAWQYGTASGMTQPATPNAVQSGAGCIDGWRGADALPEIAHNRTNTTCNMFSWQWPAGMIGFHPDNGTGEYAVIRWTAPESGDYEVTGSFQCIDSCTIDVAILHNTTVLNQQLVNQSVGAFPFAFVIHVEAGDTIDFRGGDGGNGYHFDQSVVDARIQSVLFRDGFEE